MWHLDTFVVKQHQISAVFLDFWSRDRRSQRPMDYEKSCWWLTIQVGKLVNSKLWTGNLGKDVSQLYKSKLNVTSWHLCNQTAPDSAVFLDFFGLLVVGCCCCCCWLLLLVVDWSLSRWKERELSVKEREKKVPDPWIEPTTFRVAGEDLTTRPRKQPMRRVDNYWYITLCQQQHWSS